MSNENNTANNTNFGKDDLGIIGIGVGVIGAIIGIIANRRTNKVAKAIGRTVDDLSHRDIAIDISKELIEREAARRVNEIVDTMAYHARQDALKSATTSFNALIKQEINEQYADTRAEVKRALKERVGHIDISDVKKEVIADAKEEAAAKFKDQLDDVLDSFNGRLDDVGKIYASIAKKFESK